MVGIRPRARQSGPEAVRGVHVFASGPAVLSLEVAWEGRRLAARRAARGWEVDGEAAGEATAAALDDLVAALVDLRALDVFRPHDAAGYGLDNPHGTVVLGRGARLDRLVIGGLNAAGSAYYARREGDARVLQVGTGLDSVLERVLYTRAHEHPGAG